jgi:hypothetical protein
MLTHPYENLSGGEWLRGNLHTHTTRSDGTHEPQEVLDMYADSGYDFFALSDHDIATTEEDYASMDARGMILIAGNEVTAGGPHILHVYPKSRVTPTWNRQDVIHGINSDRGFAVVAHPNFKEFDHCRIDQLLAWEGYLGLEIYNGILGRTHGSPYALNHWDRLLSSGRRPWGYAHDDFHDATKGDLARGWNMVYARERTVEAIVDALRNGCFYASTGVVITRITVDGNQVRLETENADRIVVLQELGQRLSEVDGTTAEVTVPDDARYVRFECWGRGEQFAWTQPFWTR